jgi:predicted ATPase/DNA-binding winged helix-turn-helix (wHTH) protein
VDEAYAFGPFRLYPARRLLLAEAEPVRLGSRAFDILTALVEAAGATVSNEQLIARAWPTTTVDEAALRVHVAALRKALGDDRNDNRFIANIPGRGYSFVAHVTRAHDSLPAAPVPRPPSGSLPAQLFRIIGRSETVTTLAAQLNRHRLLTIVGPGGIGKTTVGLGVAAAAMGSFPDGVWFIPLAPLADPGLVPSTIAGTLRLAGAGADPTSALAAWVRDKKALIVLDNCEHVVDEAAAITEAVLRMAPDVHVLATSREPLRVEGERLHRLSPLDVPPDRAELSADEAMQHSSVQLFVERAAASSGDFVLADAEAPALGEVCRKLDGLPLALELAAARVGALGIRALARGLNDRFVILTSGRRTALPRQQTLRAMVDWSHDLLSDTERVVLRRLAVFRGGFTLEAAMAVAADERLSGYEVVDSIADLAARSLVATDTSGDVAQHHLLETTRAYALEKLDDSGETDQVSRRHAEYFRDLFGFAESAPRSEPRAEWHTASRLHLDNIRAALQWAASPQGDAAISIALTAASVPLWIDLSMMDECRHHVEQALARLRLMGPCDLRVEMQLNAALGTSLNYTTGPVAATAEAWTRTLQIAETIGDTEYRLRGLRGLWAHNMSAGEYRKTLAFAHQFRELAGKSPDPVDLRFGDRMAAMMLHYLGDQEAALGHLQNAFAVANTAPSPTSRLCSIGK